MVALLAISKSSSWNTWWESISSGIFGTWAANKNQTVSLRLIIYMSANKQFYTTWGTFSRFNTIKKGNI